MKLRFTMGDENPGLLFLFFGHLGRYFQSRLLLPFSMRLVTTFDLENRKWQA